MSEVSKVSGRLEVIGPSKNLKEGSEYTYLRFVEAGGSVKMIKRVGVGHLVESYMKPGIEGDFYIVSLGKIGNVLFALKTPSGQKIYEPNGFSTWLSGLRLYTILLSLLFIPLSFVGLLMGGVGGVIVPIGFIYGIWKVGYKLPRVLKDKFLNSQLAANGF